MVLVKRSLGQVVNVKSVQHSKFIKMSENLQTVYGLQVSE